MKKGVGAKKWLGIVINIDGEETEYDLKPNGDLILKYRSKKRNLKKLEREMEIKRDKQQYNQPRTRNLTDTQDICDDLINFDIRQTNLSINEESTTIPQSYDIMTDTRSDTSSDNENVSTDLSSTYQHDEICILESDGFGFEITFSNDHLNAEADFFESDDFMVDEVNGFFDEAPW